MKSLKYIRRNGEKDDYFYELDLGATGIDLAELEAYPLFNLVLDYDCPDVSEAVIADVFAHFIDNTACFEQIFSIQICNLSKAQHCENYYAFLEVIKPNVREVSFYNCDLSRDLTHYLANSFIPDKQNNTTLLHFNLAPNFELPETPRIQLVTDLASCLVTGNFSLQNFTVENIELNDREEAILIQAAEKSTSLITFRLPRLLQHLQGTLLNANLKANRKAQAMNSDLIEQLTHYQEGMKEIQAEFHDNLCIDKQELNTPENAEELVVEKYKDFQQQLSFWIDKKFSAGTLLIQYNKFVNTNSLNISVSPEPQKISKHTHTTGR